MYLLGQPRSDVANFTDKRLISELIRETGNNCTVSLTMNYDKIEGAIVEFGTQNLAKAYSAIKILNFKTYVHTNDSLRYNPKIRQLRFF